MIGSQVPLGIIPAGTANVMARELGYLQKGKINVARTVQILLGKSEAAVHPFSVEFGGTNQIGLCWVGVGFDAAVLRHVNPRWKAKLGRAAFAPAMARTIFEEPQKPSVPWMVGSEKGRCSWVIAANIPKYAGPFTLTKKTSVKQQGMACLRFEKAGKMARVLDQLLLPFIPLDKRGKTVEVSGGSMSLGGPDTPVQLDGDLLGDGAALVTPLTYPLYFKAINDI